MSRAEWLRTFVAVYRTGSVTVGARSRGLSQPAASQQLAALARAVGGPVLSRGPGGVLPTARGRELYAQVAEPLDRLEDVLADLDGGRLRRRDRPVRLGASAEFFADEILPLLAGAAPPVAATFDSDTRLIELLVSGELDIAVTTTLPGRRTLLESVEIGHRGFVLVGAPACVPAEPLVEPVALGEWLGGRPWVTYSGERPTTRRFWNAVLGRPFDADVRLIAPDLRTVVSAVELGVGISLLPGYVCARGLAEGRLAEVFDVSTLAPPEPWFATTRRTDAADATITDVMARMTSNEVSAHVPVPPLDR
jgi:DNA-binding transcriptional LysR family regulator